MTCMYQYSLYSGSVNLEMFQIHQNFKYCVSPKYNQNSSLTQKVFINKNQTLIFSFLAFYQDMQEGIDQSNSACQILVSCMSSLE
jgi:hypothetical protein